MRIHYKSTSANVLFATLFTTGILSLFLGSYLSLVRSENQFTFRSQTWNAAIPIAEAGVEEALTQLTATYPKLSTDNGWHFENNLYYIKTNSFNADEYYIVGIFPPGFPNEPEPVIVSQGFARVPSQADFVSRTVKVTTKRDGPPMRGMVVVTTADISGNKLSIDSFNSTNSAFSTNGKYDKAKRSDKVVLATLSNKTNAIAIDMGNADIWGIIGSAYTGTKIKIGANSTIGSLAWHAGGNKGLQPGAYIDDLNVAVQKPVAPFANGILPTPTSGTYTLGSGDYAIETLQGNIVVTGNARLLVTKDLDISGLTIQNDNGTASLELYVAAASANISGAPNVQGSAANFKYFGLSADPAKNWAGNQKLSAGGSADFTAMIYAPETALTLKGGGNTATDFSGAALVNSVIMRGHYNFHFDESVANAMANSFTPISWDELTLTWDTIKTKKLTAKYLD